MSEADIQVRTLAALDHSRDSDSITHRKVARKVFVDRSINGLDVPSDRLVLTFTMDGELRKIIGSWHNIDFKRSSLTTTVSEADFIEKSLDELAKVRTSDTSTLPIELGTHYGIEAIGKDRFALRVAGHAIVYNVNPDGEESKTSVIDFML